MCNFTQSITLCHRCGYFGDLPQTREQCNWGRRTGTFGPSCKFARTYVYLEIRNASNIVDHCIACFTGDLWDENNRNGMRCVQAYLRRSYLTATGWSRAGHRRRQNDIYGPTYVYITKRWAPIPYVHSYARPDPQPEPEADPEPEPEADPQPEPQTDPLPQPQA